MYTIWTNDINVEDWKDDIKEQYPNIDEDEIYEVAYRENEIYLDDEKANMDQNLDNDIVVIADLGLWDGRRGAYKFAGNNLNSIFSTTCGDIVTFYVEDGEVKCKDTHHDGTNHYTYRVLNKDISRFEFEEYVYEASLKEAVEKYTCPLGKYIDDIYGIQQEEKR